MRGQARLPIHNTYTHTHKGASVDIMRRGEVQAGNQQSTVSMCTHVCIERLRWRRFAKHEAEHDCNMFGGNRNGAPSGAPRLRNLMGGQPQDTHSLDAHAWGSESDWRSLVLEFGGLAHSRKCPNTLNIIFGRLRKARRNDNAASTEGCCPDQKFWDPDPWGGGG